ncbi:E3 ubiquitin-protein ligase PDZRN3-like isoform X1 [Haliotis rufescens]|uniref:E3 ubiquitin-protein ligase PDZRN3-like isoform X1 n=1 Tax=Haliotis rufescens TaxID=6454 RepID=UPI001EAF9212|nr:E3 ubiquitin-protein ligase PDZRN3-like isoform X1 [Haliotis rufescens]XP_046352809.1 E3 ubiquitin-protein ligase PDZRN3-like isoform X1 [Haliotis rufescens]XP_048248405.1 E3 ubiquitin-protein ligase PDZRN3-like isoform X1 [Haliotis rufescens]
MGLDLTLFVGTIDPNLICSICSQVFVNPVSNSCHHIFCQSCIRRRSKSRTSRYCPECSTKLHAESSEVSVELKLKLLRLRIKCNHGCGIVCELADLPDHVADVCPNAPVSCPYKNVGCCKTVKRCEASIHAEECYHRFVDCEACGFRIQYCDLFTHQSKTRCLEKKLRQQVARAAKSTNLEVRRHRDYVLRQHFQLERHQRQAVMSHFRSKQQSYLDSVRSKHNDDTSDDMFSDSSPRPKDSVAENQSLVLSFGKSPRPSHAGQNVFTCKNCKKPFREAGNHSMACTYHAGPVSILFLFTLIFNMTL